MKKPPKYLSFGFIFCFLEKHKYFFVFLKNEQIWIYVFLLELKHILKTNILNKWFFWNTINMDRGSIKILNFVNNFECTFKNGLSFWNFENFFKSMTMLKNVNIFWKQEQSETLFFLNALSVFVLRRILIWCPLDHKQSKRRQPKTMSSARKM